MTTTARARRERVKAGRSTVDVTPCVDVTCRREHVVLYARLSENKSEKESVENQLTLARRQTEQRGQHVVATFTDDDLSAWKSAVRRPGFDALMSFLREQRGDVRAIVVYAMSRLLRNRVERAQSIDTLAALRVRIDAVRGDSLDLSNASGAMLADILGALDTAESAIKSERVTDEAAARAAKGKASSVCAFGWRRVATLNDAGVRVDWRDEIDERAAAIVREVVDRLLDGESLRAVTLDLNARRVPTPAESRALARRADSPAWVGEGRWLARTVQQIASRPANVALRVYHGEIVGPAEWDAIVDETKHAQICARFSDPARRNVTRERPTDRRWLLTCSEWATCGVCGSELTARNIKRRGAVGRRYVCRDNGCVQRDADKVDQQLVALVLLWLNVPGNVARLLDGDTSTNMADLIAERARLLDEQATMSVLVSQRQITPAQLVAYNVEIQPQIATLDEQIRRAASRRGSRDVEIRTPAEWRALSLDRQRLLLEALRVRVELLRTRKGGHTPYRHEDTRVTIAEREAV